MVKVIGRDAAIGIAIEAVRGTKQTPDYWVPVESYSYDDKVEYAKNRSAQGHIAEMSQADIVKLWGAGEYSGKIFLDSIGVELRALFGDSPTSTQRGVSGVYDHVFAIENSNFHDSLTVAYKDDIQGVSFPLAMIHGWRLDITADGFVKRTVALIGQKSETTSHTPVFVDEIEFIPGQVSFKIASTSAGLDAASSINVLTLKLQVAKNVEALYDSGSDEPSNILNKHITVNGEVEIYFENEVQRNKVFGGTYGAIRINMQDIYTDLGSGHRPEINFDLAQVAFTEFQRNWDANDPLRFILKFDALFNVDHSSMISARLTNLQTSY